jgi:phosphatase NudJ
VREAIGTWFFALVVVRRGKSEFLLVHERKHNQEWYLPAGRVEPGERIVDAARRETLEESGVPVELEGIVRVEHSPFPDGTARMRVIFVARPVDERAPKSQPDSESLGAAWVKLDELHRFPLRGHEVAEILGHVAGGGRIYPLDLLTVEGARY